MANEKDQRKGWCKILVTIPRDFLFEIVEDTDFIDQDKFKLKITTKTNTCEVCASLSCGSGFSYEQAKELLDNANEDTMEKLLAEIFNNESWKLTLEDLDKEEEE